MPKGTATLDRLMVSVPVGAVIIVAIIGAMSWFFEKVPNKNDIEGNQAMSLRISAWVKEELTKVDSRQIASEKRVLDIGADNHREILRRLEVIEGVERDILSRLPRRVAIK